jgi:sodium-dependent dicarboxylate transporter 2/3/5
MAIAAGSSIGGIGTLVGTPPTAQFAAFMRDKLQVTVTFLEWMALGVPIIAVFVPVTWIVLTRIAFKVDNELIESVGDVIRTQRESLGPMNAHQSRTLAVFLLTVAAWVTSAYTGLNDSIIAMCSVVLLCLIPCGGIGSPPLLTWKAASKAPWGIWLLFGGGLSLADAIDRTGLAQAISSQAGIMQGAPVLLVMFMFAAAAVMLTELSNNTALVAMGLPIAQAVSASFGIPPQVLMVTVVLTASLGFMLPSGTAANALVFQTGRISVKEMARAGLLLDVLSAIMVPLVVYGFWKMGVLPGA